MTKGSSRACLFGGAFLTAGLGGALANAQELVRVDGGDNRNYFELGGYVCFPYMGDPCFVYDSVAFVLWDPTGRTGLPVVDDAAIGDEVYAIVETPAKFALTQTPRPADRPADALSTARAYFSARFSVTEDALIRYSWDVADVASLTIGGLTLDEPGQSGEVTVSAGDLVSLFGITYAIRDGFSVEIVGVPCNPADLAEPFGQTTFADISAFLTAFLNQDPAADLAAPDGQFTFADVSVFVTLFSDGCP